MYLSTQSKIIIYSVIGMVMHALLKRIFNLNSQGMFFMPMHAMVCYHLTHLKLQNTS